MSKIKVALLSIFSGLLLGLSAYPFIPGYLLFVAFVPIFLIEEHFFQNKNITKPFTFFLVAWLTTTVWNIVSLWWICKASYSAMIMFILYNSFLYAVVLNLLHFLHKRLSSNFAYAAFLFVWIAFEYVNHEWPWSFPFLSLGNSFSGNTEIIQWYEKTGTMGGTLWVLFVNIMVFSIYKRFMQNQPKIIIYSNGTFLLLIISIPILYSLFLLNQAIDESDKLKVHICQTQVDPFAKSDKTQITKTQTQFEQLLQNTPDETDVILFPETAIANPTHKDSITNIPEGKILSSKLTNKANIICGVFSYEMDSKSGNDIPNFNSDNWKEYAKAYNSAVLLNSDSVSYYDKRIMVTGVEKMPFSEHIPIIDKMILSFGGIKGSLNVGQSSNILKLNNGHISGISICWENVFGAYTAASTTKGADFLSVITNDAWWGGSAGHEMVFGHVRLRALEARKYAICSTNAGISGIVDTKGNVVDRTEAFSGLQTITGEIKTNNIVTDYAKSGDYIGRTALFISILLLIYVWVQDKVGRKMV